MDETPFSVRALHVNAYIFHYAVVDIEEAGEEGNNEPAEGECFGRGFSGDDKRWVID